jgi:uncharacterized protein (TIGR00255 family)
VPQRSNLQNLRGKACNPLLLKGFGFGFWALTFKTKVFNSVANCQFADRSWHFSYEVHPYKERARFDGMIESMTGFATLDFQKDGYELNLSLRSVNSRYLETRVRLPASVTYYDGLFKEVVKKHVSRGKIDIEVNLGTTPEEFEKVQVDTTAVLSVHKELTVLKERLRLEGEVSLETLARVMGNQMFRHKTDKTSLDETLSIIMEAVEQGLHKLLLSRRNEGEVLERDLRSGIENLSGVVNAIETCSEGLTDVHRARLTKKIEGLNLRVEGDESAARIEMEIAMLSEKLDIHEELVRLRAHIESVEKTLSQKVEACGKRLDFLLQEIIREINTVGSKVPDAKTRGLVVDMKTCVETLRQQVANVA